MHHRPVANLCHSFQQGCGAIGELDRHLVQEDVVHPVRCIDADVETRVLAAAVLHDPVRDEIRRRVKFIGRDDLEKFRLDPVDHVGDAEMRANVVDPHFVMRPIVSEAAGAGAFIARYVQILERERAVTEMQIRGRAIRPDATETRALHREVAIACPSFRIA